MEIKYSTKGFEPIEPHQVYRLNGIISDGKDEIPIPGIVTLRRYTAPSEDDVVNYLQEKARELKEVARLVLPEQSREIKSLDDLIKKLPAQVLSDMSLRNENCMEFIRENTTAILLEEGEKPSTYIMTRFGIIPPEAIKISPDSKFSDWYDIALSSSNLKKQGYGEKWKMQLLYKESLPPQSEIEILIKHRTQHSQTFQVSRHYNRNEIDPVISFLYENYATVEEINQIRDTSHDELEKAAIPSIMALHELAKKQREAEQREKDKETEQERIAKKLILG